MKCLDELFEQRDKPISDSSKKNMYTKSDETK